ncbi:MAG: response regulator [Proteobacteria bacterium]|nr:response regulator [Pseudomonadota bacterium]
MGAQKGKHGLEVILLDASKFYLSLTRSMLLHMSVGRIRAYEDPVTALRGLLLEPSGLIIVDAQLPMTFSCLRLIRGLRHASLAPLCFVPIIVTTAWPTEQFIDNAIRNGAHAIVAKPFSPRSLKQRIDWALGDHHRLVINRGYYVVEDSIKSVEERAKRASPPALAALLRGSDQPFSDVTAVQSMIDMILSSDADGDDKTRRAA